MIMIHVQEKHFSRNHMADSFNLFLSVLQIKIKGSAGLATDHHDQEDETSTKEHHHSHSCT
jgi:hypothetical protein